MAQINNPTLITEETFDLSAEATVYIDEKNLKDPSLLDLSLFEKPKLTPPNLGYIKGKAWAYLRVMNQLNKRKQWILKIAHARIDLVKIHVINETTGATQTKEVSRLEPFHARVISHRFAHFPITLEPYQKYQVFLEISNESSTVLPLKLYTPIAYANATHDEQLFYGLYYGVIIVMALYNLALYFSLRDRAYIYCIGSILFTHGIAQALLAGHAYEYLWPELYNWNKLALPFTIGIAASFTIMFAREFQRFRELNPNISKYLFFLAHLSWVVGLLAFVDHYRVAIFTVQLLILVAAPSILFLSFRSLRKGFRSAKFFLYAWGFVLVAMIAAIFKSMGILPSNIFSEQALAFGSALEVILLSLGLGDRYSQINKEKKRIAAQMHQAEQTMNHARIMQKTLLPAPTQLASFDIATYYQAAEKAGGDWYNWQLSADERTLFVGIGDVTGHGLGAALVTGVAAGCWQSFFSSPQSSSHDHITTLEYFIKMLNKTLLVTAAKEKHAMTFLGFAIDTRTNNVTVVNCGHVQPIVAAKGKSRFINCRGSMLGIDEEVHATPVHFSLGKEETLLLMTDGLYENSGPNGKTLKTKRLKQIVSADFLSGSSIIESIINNGQDIWLDEPPADDLAILSICRVVNGSKKILKLMSC